MGLFNFNISSCRINLIMFSFLSTMVLDIILIKCYTLKVFLDSSAAEHSAVNRRVVGSNPTRGVIKAHWSSG